MKLTVIIHWSWWYLSLVPAGAFFWGLGGAIGRDLRKHPFRLWSR